jgi:hypothetical protein
MSFDLHKILADKRRPSSQLAGRPIEEKLWILDSLRQREVAIRESVECRVRSAERGDLAVQELTFIL